MRILLFFFIILVFPLWGYGQASAFRADSIPVVDGKIVFHVDLKSILSKEEALTKASAYLNDVLNPHKGEFHANTEDHIVCRITDYVSISSGFFHTTGMYMNYSLMLVYKDRTCELTIWDIKYVEKQHYEAQEEHFRKLFIPEYPAEEIMLDGAYKVMFVKKASQKLTQASIDRFNGIVKDLEDVFYNEN